MVSFIIISTCAICSQLTTRLTHPNTPESTEDGSIIASLPPDPDHVLDVTDGIEKSVELEQELSQNNS